MKALNRFYLDHPAFSEEDYDRTGFKWIECSAQEQCVYAFERRSAKERIAAVFNFSDEEQEFVADLDGAGVIKKIFDSAGSEDGAEQIYDRKKNRFRLPPFSAGYYSISGGKV